MGLSVSDKKVRVHPNTSDSGTLVATCGNQPGGVKRLDGARGKKQVWRPMFEPEVFRKQMHCIVESICDIVGTFRRPPQWFGARTIVPALFRLVTPLQPTQGDNSVRISILQSWSAFVIYIFPLQFLTLHKMCCNEKSHCLLKYLLLEKFAVLHLNMTGFLKVVQRSHTSNSLIPHKCDQWAKKVCLQSNFQQLLKLKPCWFFVFT